MHKPSPYIHEWGSETPAKDDERLKLSCMLEPVVRNLQSWGVLAPTTSDEEVSDRAEVLLVLIFLALALILLVPTYFFFDQIEKYNERARVVKWTIRHISDVQVTIERLAIEIDQRDSKLSDLRDTCRKLDINWGERPNVPALGA